VGPIENPKIRGFDSFPSSWYRFYPGFSEKFARSILLSAGLVEGDWVLDPWNGGGTTTSTSASLGLNVYGYDLNPAMVIVAKARCLDPAEYPSLRPLGINIIRRAENSFVTALDDPLLTWLTSGSVTAVRSIEAAIQRLLVDHGEYKAIRVRGTDSVSDLAAFFYVALFRTLRHILRPFLTSNPTWLKQPHSCRARLRPDVSTVRDVFRSELAKMMPPRAPAHGARRSERVLGIASSEKLPLPDNAVKFILASPPYCTRIDYAMATSSELALLGFGQASGFDELRRKLMGAATVPKIAPHGLDEWGGTCLQFLEGLRGHASKASSTYYYKNHVKYFHSLSCSISEMSRVMTPGAGCVLVVQDSYYKDLHNDLPLIITEMASSRRLILRQRDNFHLSRTMAGIHPGTRSYRNFFGATESVLFLERTSSRTKDVHDVSDVIQPIRRDVVGAP
jgi:hypothetical protein